MKNFYVEESEKLNIRSKIRKKKWNDELLLHFLWIDWSLMVSDLWYLHLKSVFFFSKASENVQSKTEISQLLIFCRPSADPSAQAEATLGNLFQNYFLINWTFSETSPSHFRTVIHHLTEGRILTCDWFTAVKVSQCVKLTPCCCSDDRRADFKPLL